VTDIAPDLVDIYPDDVLEEIAEIIAEEAARARVRVDAVMGPSRLHQVCKARHTAMKRVAAIVDEDGARLLAVDDVAAVFGRDRSSVLYAYRKGA